MMFCADYAQLLKTLSILMNAIYMVGCVFPFDACFSYSLDPYSLNLYSLPDLYRTGISSDNGALPLIIFAALLVSHR